MSARNKRVETAAMAIFAIDSRPLGRPETPWRQLLPSARAYYMALARAALAAAAAVDAEENKAPEIRAARGALPAADTVETKEPPPLSIVSDNEEPPDRPAGEAKAEA
jgi:hypothetical protein